MKKYVLLIISVIVAATWLCACSSDNDDDDNDFDVFNPNAIQPIMKEGAVVDFFNSEFYKSFFDDEFRDLDHHVYVINSRQELADIYFGEKELPAIDFDKYTLIIGQLVMPYPGFYFVKRELEPSENGLQLTIYVRNDGEVLSCVLKHLYFWEIYPKQSQKTISVKVLHKYTQFPDDRSDY